MKCFYRYFLFLPDASQIRNADRRQCNRLGELRHPNGNQSVGGWMEGTSTGKFHLINVVNGSDIGAIQYTLASFKQLNAFRDISVRLTGENP